MPAAAQVRNSGPVPVPWSVAVTSPIRSIISGSTRFVTDSMTGSAPTPISLVSLSLRPG
jgi:hypothetical protein